MTGLGLSDGRASGPSFFTVTYVEVVPPSAAQGATLLKHYRDGSLKDDGSLRLEVLQRRDRPTQLTVLAAWTDQDAFEAHLGRAPVVQLNQELTPILAAPNDTRQHGGLTVADARAARSLSITVVTHVDVVPQYKDDAVVALQQLAEDSRGHSGNLRFDVWQQTNRPNHFTVVEGWSSRRTFDAHAMAEQTTGFRANLAVMAGALYDERQYRSLN